MEGLKVKHAEGWKHVPNHIVTICSGELNKLKKDNAELLEACQEAMKLVEVARQYFPKSIHNGDKFKLENTCAMIGNAIAKTEGKL